MKQSISIVLGVVLAGCASSGAGSSTRVSGDRSIDPSQATTIRLTPDISARADSIGAPIDVVWGRLQGTFAALGIPVTTVDPKNHTIGAVRAQVRGRLGSHRMGDVLDCGSEPAGAPRSESYMISLTVVTELTPAGAATRSRTSVSATSRDPNGSSGDLQCGSKGVIEAEIAAALAKP